LIFHFVNQQSRSTHFLRPSGFFVAILENVGRRLIGSGMISICASLWLALIGMPQYEHFVSAFIKTPKNNTRRTTERL
jgi:hypothetical protein